jgi:hypothetical protein
MRYLRTVQDCARLGHIENKNTKKELKRHSIQIKVDKNRNNSINDLDRMSYTVISNHILQYETKEAKTKEEIGKD